MQRKRFMRVREYHGFTLVELLVVIAIISILAAMLLPVLSDALEQGRRVACAGNMRQIYLSTVCYVSDFNDILPPAGFRPGGSNIGVSSLNAEDGGRKWGPTRIWARDYLGIPLYTAPKMYAGVPITTVSGLYANKVYFPEAGTRGMLHCPGSRLDESTNWQHWSASFDYWLPGFGMYNLSSVSPPPNSRFTKAATSAPDGKPKTFITDSLFKYNAAWYAIHLYTLGSGHQPANPEGMNVMRGDGSTRWVERDKTVVVAGSHYYAPRGYYTQISWCHYSPTYGGYRQFMILSPAGVAKTYNDYGSTAPDYYKWMREWY